MALSISRSNRWTPAWVSWVKTAKNPIAIVYRTDRRSARAADLLARQGFTEARVAQGGMTAWLEHGWDLPREI